MARRKKPSGRIAGFGRARSKKDLRRIRGQRTPKKIIVIVCEGKETEPNYFDSMRETYRLSTLNIKIIPESGSPIKLVDEAINEKGNLDYPHDEAWCVFDTEQNINNILNVIDKARRRGLGLAISNPSFEYWFLLHFEYTDRPFRDADDVIDQLKNHIPNYDKSAEVYSILEDRTGIAMENASNLRENAAEPWDNYPNPSTWVDSLVNSIMNMS
jgi:hypothetical protein